MAKQFLQGGDRHAGLGYTPAEGVPELVASDVQTRFAANFAQNGLDALD